ncbi:MAG: hypothetical protein JWQ74_1317 [Marmoricola sp.]|nr:hypothetical protein [Marmoricola sp.]
MVPLIIGFALVVGLLVAVVVDASAAYLRREGMNALADAAALAATDGIQGALAYGRGLDDGFAVDPDTARRYVGAYLSSTGAVALYAGLSWRVSTSGRTVTVVVRAPFRLPLRAPGTGEGSSVSGSARAVLRIGG